MESTEQLGLQVLSQFLRRVTGLKGCRYVDNATVYPGGKFASIVVIADAVITSATTSSGADLLALWGAGSNTLPAGTYLSVDSNDPGAAVAITSGSVMVYYE